MIKTYLPSTNTTTTIDAKGQVLGRVASEIASVLRGKNKPTFAPNKIVGDKVVVINAAAVRYTGNKISQKMYYKHTGYIGNLKSMTLGQLIDKDPSEPLRRAVLGMLPSNRLKKELLKRLTIHAGDLKEQIPLRTATGGQAPLRPMASKEQA